MWRKNNAMDTSRYRAVMASKDGHWLPENSVPEGWKRARLEDVAEINPKRPRLNVDDEVPTTFIPMAAVAEDCVGIAAREIRPYREVSRGYTYFEENDVLLAKITPCLQNGKHALATSLEGGFGFGTTEFHVIRAGLKIDPRHLFRILTSPTNIERCERSFNGTAGQQRVHPDTVRGIPLLLPPLPEQRAIAAVLDSIDAAIERTEEVIAATEQLRDCLLHELLTRGVPGWHTEWKDVPGLGTIPADWDVVRLGDVAEVRSGQSDPRKPIFQNSMFIAPDDIESATGKLLRKRTVADARAISGKYEFDERDVVYSKIRPYLMKVYLPKGAGLCSADMYPLRTKSGLLRHYLAFALLSREFTAYARTCSDRTGIPKINRDDLLKYRLPLPRREEQHSIADTIEGADEAITQADEARKRLQELKASAADALLTGRVRTLEDRAVENG